MISQHLHQAITWGNVDPVFCRHMASLGPNELKRHKKVWLQLWYRDDFAYALANERRRYNVTSLIGWAHAQNDPWWYVQKTPHVEETWTS